MSEFQFVKATDLKNAYAVLSKLGASALPVAGGTNVMPLIRMGKAGDRTLVNIRELDALTGIKLYRGRVTVGSLTTIAALAASDLLRDKAPALYMAANVFADPTTRNSATVGGNLAFSSPAADSAPPLLALGATLVLGSEKGKRRLPLHEFFAGVNKNVLEPGELIVAVEFPTCPHSAFYKLGLRNAMAISVATAAAALHRDKNNCITEIRLAMGSVAPTPVRCYHVEEALLGHKASGELLPLIEQAVAQDIRPIDDVRASAEYRRLVAPVLLNRVIAKACGHCVNEGGDQ